MAPLVCQCLWCEAHQSGLGASCLSVPLVRPTKRDLAPLVCQCLWCEAHQSGLGASCLSVPLVRPTSRDLAPLVCQCLWWGPPVGTWRLLFVSASGEAHQSGLGASCLSVPLVKPTNRGLVPSITILLHVITWPFQYWASFTNNAFFHLLQRGCTPMQLSARRSKQWTWIFNYESTRWPPSIWPQAE
jgi:hypothetical protein